MNKLNISEKDNYSTLYEQICKSINNEEKRGISLLLISLARKENKQVSFEEIKTTVDTITTNDNVWLTIMHKYLNQFKFYLQEVKLMEGNEILNQILQIVLPILATFLTGLFTQIGTRLKKVYEEKVNTETAKAVVEDAVRFVEQVYKDLHGKEKLEKATAQVEEVLQSKGITISEAEINMLIESAVYGLNEGWFNYADNTLDTDKTDNKTITDNQVSENE